MIDDKLSGSISSHVSVSWTLRFFHIEGLVLGLIQASVSDLVFEVEDARGVLPDTVLFEGESSGWGIITDPGMNQSQLGGASPSSCELADRLAQGEAKSRCPVSQSPSAPAPEWTPFILPPSQSQRPERSTSSNP